jgi:hypothetical protein
VRDFSLLQRENPLFSATIQDLFKNIFQANKFRANGENDGRRWGSKMRSRSKRSRPIQQETYQVEPISRKDLCKT